MSTSYNKRPKQTPLHGIRLDAQCRFTHANVKYFFNEAIKSAATLRDDAKPLKEALRHLTTVLEATMSANRR